MAGNSNFKLTIPPAHVPADLSLSFSDFNVAQIVAKELPQINNFIHAAIATGPFVNITLEQDKFYQSGLAELIEYQDNYGKDQTLKEQRIFIEYSSPNIAKPIGVGHLRSTIIGESLARLYEDLGAKVIRENYLGDWGTQFGKLIYAYQHWADRQKIARNPIPELKNLYVMFQKKAEANPQIEAEARKIFSALEAGDQDLKKLWQEFRKLSIREFKRVYRQLGIKFDIYSGESQFAQSAAEIISECVTKNICQEGSDSSVYAELPGLPSFILKKSDGTTLYLARDLAALKFRIEKYKPHYLFYVVGSEQKLHFQQLFALAQKLGFLNGYTAEHISFGLVKFGGKKMSTRKGTTIDLEELINKAIKEAEKVLAQKSEIAASRRLRLAKLIGIGAIFYNDLRQFREKDINFDWQKMINFEGNSSAYLQYTYARIKSILRKAKFKPVANFTGARFESEFEFDLLKKLFFFPEIIKEAAEKKSPNLIAAYLEDLTQSFNSFYGKISVIKTEDKNLKQSRLYLINSVANVIKRGLYLLGIEAPEKM